MAKAKKEITIEQRSKRERRGGASQRRTGNGPIPVERRLSERREKVNRRRQIDPTTCERDYTEAEVEFMHALDLYSGASGRMFPTCSEVLEVLRGLGYEKQPGAVMNNSTTTTAVVAASLLTIETR